MNGKETRWEEGNREQTMGNKKKDVQVRCSKAKEERGKKRRKKRDNNKKRKYKERKKIRSE